MARILTSGFEIATKGAVASTNIVDVDGGSSSATNFVIQATTFRSGAKALQRLASTSLWRSNWAAAGVADRTYYARFYFRIAGTASSTQPIMEFTDGTLSWGRVVVTTAMKWRLQDGAGNAVGSDSVATIVANTWYCVELAQKSDTQANEDYLELRIDGEVIASTTTNDTITAAPCGIQFGSPVSIGQDCFYDDLAVNDDQGTLQNFFPGQGKVVLLAPISDSQVGSWTGGAGGGSSLFDAVNNTPPVGTATETNTSQIENATNGGGTAYRANLTTYATAGLVPTDGIAVVHPVINHGEDAATGTKTGSFGLQSNPANPSGGGETGFTFGDDAGALGTWPTNWRWALGAPIYYPSVAMATSPVLEVRRITASTTVCSVDFMGVYVDYVPGVVPPTQINLARATRRLRRPPPVISTLRPPVVVDPVVSASPARPIQVNLAAVARRLRRPPPVISTLRPPTVVSTPQLGFFGPGTRRTDALSRRDLVRRQPHSFLRRPVIAPVVALAPPTAVHLARSRRGAPKSILHPPQIVDAQRFGFSGPSVRLVDPLSARDLVRRQPHSFLHPPAVITAVAALARPILIYLAPSSRGTPKSILHPPQVVDAQQFGFAGPSTRLTDPTSRRDLTRRQPRSFLRPPIPAPVVALARPINVELAYSSRGRPKSKLGAPVVVAPVLARPPQVELAYSRRGKPKSKLSAPAVVGPVLARRIDVTLAISRRGLPKSILRSPTTVNPVGFVARPTKVALAYSRRGKPLSSLKPPVVLDANTAYPQGPAVSLAPQRRGTPKSRLRLPVAVAAPVFYARPIKVELAYSRRGRPLSILRAPTDVDAQRFGFFGPSVRLVDPLSARDLLRRQPFSFLRPPVTVTAAPVAFFARKTDVTLAPQRRGVPKYFLRPPQIIDAQEVGFFGPGIYLVNPLTVFDILRRKPYYKLSPPVNLTTPPEAEFVPAALMVYSAAPSGRRRTRSFLRPPVVVGTQLGFFGPGTRRADPFSRRDMVRRRPHSKLSPPISTRVLELARPTSVTLAYSRRGKPLSDLGYPVVLDGNDAYPLGPQVNLTYSRRGVPKSRLARPAVVGAAAVLARPVLTHLAPQRRGKPKSELSAPVVVAPVLARRILTSLVRIRPVAIHSILRRPTDLVDQADLGLVRTHLAYSRRGRPLSYLAPPVVVGAILARPTTIHLAPSTRGRPRSILRDPVVVGPVLAPPIQTTLARIRPVRTLALLHLPTVVFTAVELSGPEITLAPQSRGVPKSFLLPPVDVVDREDLGRIDVTLAPQSRRPGRWHLGPMGPPAVVYAPLAINLTYSLRGKPKSILRLPVFGAPTPRAEMTLAATLAYSLRGKPKSRLQPPTVVTAATPYLRPIDVTVAYQSRGEPKSILRPPVVVGSFIASAITVTLAPQRRGVPKSELRPPVVVFPFFARKLPTTLAPQRRGVPESRLRPPVVVAAFVIPVITTNLAPQSRGVPKSILHPPVVVLTAVELSGPEVTLAPQSRRRGRWLLRPMGGPAVVYAPLFVHLTYSRRGRPLSILRKPVFGAQTPKAETTLAVTLAYQSRGKPKSRLRPPVVVTAATPYLRPVAISLAYQSRGEPRSFLRPPVVVAAFTATPIAVTLAPQRRGRPSSLLAAPTVVGRAGFAPIATSLAYSRRGRPKSQLRPPAVVQPPFERPARVEITLAPQRRGKPKSELFGVVYPARVHAPIQGYLTKPRDTNPTVSARLAPPTVVIPVPPVIPLGFTQFARIRPVAVHSRLAPPAVVGAGIYFRGILTHLTYSSRGRTMSRLRLTEGVIVVCYGDVCGVDYAAFVCGGDSATAEVIGGDEAGGAVTGGDEKRAGC